MSEWIFFDEKNPPKDSEMYLVYGKSDCWCCNFLETRAASYDKDDKCFYYGEYSCPLTALYYMPFPEPPDIMYCTECKNESVACVCL